MTNDKVIRLKVEIKQGDIVIVKGKRCKVAKVYSQTESVQLQDGRHILYDEIEKTEYENFIDYD